MKKIKFLFIGALLSKTVYGLKVDNKFDPLDVIGSGFESVGNTIFSGLKGVFGGIGRDIQEAFDTVIDDLTPKTEDVEPQHNIQEIAAEQEKLRDSIPAIESDITAIQNVVNELTVGASINAAKGLNIEQTVLKPNTEGPVTPLNTLKTVEKEQKKIHPKEFLESLTKPSSIVSDYTAPIIVIQAPETTPSELISISEIMRCQGGSNWSTAQQHKKRMKEYKDFNGKHKQQIKDQIQEITQLLEEKDDAMTDMRNKLRRAEIELAETPSDVVTLEIKLLNQQMNYLAEEIVVLDNTLAKLERKIK
ncbi:uncharacterized protein CMU_027410 [Cryptosporidium muris RN66]|uniref:Uncharacterized protein n=1 Tax=Cryptosporidium muris (strain RN66) TaxID=441375 RepID=B6ABH9_CRYMR|nr:uncharacterized protein CMU_027410 [Cryptosporidium muris RN66]EEA05731.1 hypothetical protein, conserved [Cryptosporidium muris RN66]|eukprot:XP_002140080.1 hypothetical protein [Cryptosporidium muris RN66]